MSATRICMVTGSRAEYGLLHTLMQRIAAEPRLCLQIAVTGSHLAPEYGSTGSALAADGFTPDGRVEMLLSSDSAVGAAKSIGLGVIGFADLFERLRPHRVVLLGDRFEIFAAATAAYTARIPIAHIGGGDITEGALDEAYRHAITKMADLHFVTNARAARIVRQLGETERSIFNVGHPGIDRILELPLLARSELERTLGFALRPRNVLVTHHPATLGERSADDELEALLRGLDELGSDVGVLFTQPNSDPAGRRMHATIKRYAAQRPHVHLSGTLGQLVYFSAVRACDAVVGNSSSGICEVPALGKPSVDIGARQRGRLCGPSVIRCEADGTAVAAAIRRAWRLDCRALISPYGHGGSADRMVKILLRRSAGRTSAKIFEEVNPS
ncbi:UDP-N-acetylglucosamine 2-epimerase (hydrolyzing) [Paenibacillus sp. IB182496]|uniref:UDP-N-acetylglucosamine 2-epimerase (Hydrolyzing) n=1 Tax=Paenibacillus sabuli TaxID=2772509 RepID=A0A927BPV1_9BACL|nr:UDP-N-acetylglucosamine 2-epimerase [Paenibacillus sabuli]MBD2844511.1 UDP-N-acetylglucosamine 2-epimerase (hydrolyzing) [Paenibacillus sabuli]